VEINKKTFYLGIDIGAVSVKTCLLSHADNLPILKNILDQNNTLFLPEFMTHLADKSPVVLLLSKYQRVKGEPLQAGLNLLYPMINKLPGEHNILCAATGSNGKVISQFLDIPYQNEFQSIARSMGLLHPEVRTILEMGGDTSKYILLDTHSADGFAGISDYEVNGDCAAGTGSFLDQQATRLLYKIEDIGDIVAGAGKAANIAGRCSVFAKSDMIHAQQKGFQPPEILKGLCQAVVRNFKGTIVKGKEIIPPIAFIGGVSANKGIINALTEIFKVKESDLVIPKFYTGMGAIGAALQSLQDHNITKVEKFRSNIHVPHRSSQAFETVRQIQRDKLILLKHLEKPYQKKTNNPKTVTFLGIDIGSVTTKLAIIDQSGNLIKGIYTKTQARPIEVVKTGLREIEMELGDQIEISGVGTTGSGRELIGELVGADIIKDEITAHKTGSMFISSTHTKSKVDTIFDIGGQDSKYISIENGVVVDFTMNEACAAGTGSFLEEQAEKLGISIKNEFAKLAFQSQNPIRLGERCTVFMEKEITPFLQQGAQKKDIVAGLAYSIVYNYLNRVVRGRKIGDFIYFQGGTAYNEAVAAAFATVLKKEIIVPPHNGILGAIGAALLAQEESTRNKKSTQFRGFNLDNIKYTLRSFTCKGCTNFCDIQEFNVEGKKTYWGDKCSERYRKEIKVSRKPVIPDLLKKREELLMETYGGEKNNALTIGIPRAMYFYDQFPFWNTYFKELGANVVLSDETNRAIVNAGVESRVAEPCFPITVAHGHISNLIDKEVDFIFIPNVIDAESNEKTNSFYCPWGQTLCFVILSTPRFMPYKEKILYPNIRYRIGKHDVKKEYHPIARKLGFSTKKSDRAIELAYDAWYSFSNNLRKIGKDAIETLTSSNEMGLILLGRPYNIYDKIINLNIPEKLINHYGLNVIPLDFLTPDEQDITEINANMFWNYGQKIIKTAKWTQQHENFHLIYITNFKCGPDSYIKHYIGEASGKPHLTIQFDEHGNDAGIVTRCEAYLDSKGFLR